MQHIIHDAETGAERVTDVEWLPFGKAVSDYVCEKAKRGDIVAFVGEGAGMGASVAVFRPPLAQVEIDRVKALGEYTTPDVFPSDRFADDIEAQIDWPLLTGLLRHEASHARHSHYDPRKIDERYGGLVGEVAKWLEELRVEFLALKEDPNDRPFLRTSALDIVAREVDITQAVQSGLMSMAQMVTLVYGRVDAGVLDFSDISGLQPIFDKFLPEGMIEAMAEHWVKSFKLSDFDWDKHGILAKQLLETIVSFLPEDEREKAEEQNQTGGVPMPGSGGGDTSSDQGSGGTGGSGSEQGEQEQSESGSSGGGGGDSQEESDSSGAGSGDADADADADAESDELSELEQALHDLLEEMKDTAETIVIEATDEVYREINRRIEDDALKRWKEQQEQLREQQQAAAEVFGDSLTTTASDAQSGDDQDGSKGAGVATGHSSSRPVSSRPPKSSEIAAAVEISRALERAAYKDRTVVKTHDELPPGDLDGSELLTARAQKAKGLEVTAQPWVTKKRQFDETPELRLGLVVDVSGSMDAAMTPMGVATWLFSEAVRHVNGLTAAAYFGSGVFSTLKPGEFQDEVVTYNCPDGTDYFDVAVNAVDGALELSTGTGARLLVVVSDMAFWGHQEEKAKPLIKNLVQSGVGVVILPFDYGAYAAHYSEVGAEVITQVMDPVTAVSEIGDRLVAALEVAMAARGDEGM